MSDGYDWLDNALDKMDDEAIDSMREWKYDSKEEKEKTKTVQKGLSIIEDGDTKKVGRPKGDKWILTPHMMMKKLIDLNKMIVRHYNGGFYLYEEGRYSNEYKGVPIEIFIGDTTQRVFYNTKKNDKTLGNEVNDRYIKDISGQFERTYRIYDIDINRNLIGVKNGILDISIYPYKLLGQDPNIFTAVNLPIKYDPSIGSADLNFKKFERDILIKKFVDEEGNFHDKDSEITLDLQMRVFEEMFGYALEYGYPIKKAILLLGPPNCGKTTFYNVMYEFFGKQNISSVSLYDLGDRNRPAEMVGKLVNNVADISYNIMEGKTIENFMLYTGGEKKIQVEKKYRDPFLYNPTIKQYFGSNFTPRIDLDNDPFFSRWTIIKLPDNNFPFDGDFIHGLTTEREKSGILNLALDGLMRIRKNKDFSFSQNIDTVRTYFERYKPKKNDKKERKERSDKWQERCSYKDRSDKGKKRGSYKNGKRRIDDEDIVGVGG